MRVKISQQYNNIQEFQKKFDIKQEDDDNANFFSYKLKVYNERQLVLRIYEYVQNQAVLEGMGAYGKNIVSFYLKLYNFVQIYRLRYKRLWVLMLLRIIQ